MPLDVLLVNLPPYESYYTVGVPHLGMLYVLTSLRHHGYTVGYLDCARRGVRRHHVLDRIQAAEPRMVGFSVDIDNLFSVAHMTRDLKHSIGSDLKVVLGGPASQGQPLEIMERTVADVLVIGEGEESAREVADCLLRNKGDLSGIPGLCFRRDGKLIQTGARPPIANLDAITFPDRRFLQDPHSYEVSMITGRGCPFRCTFCFEGRMGNRYRHRSPENIVAEVEDILSIYGRAFVHFNDDTFSADPEHTARVCKLLRERFRPGDELQFFCEVRVDVIDRHPELVDDLVSAGVARIQIGVESADPEVLRAYKRLNVKPKVVEKTVKAFHEAGVTSIYCGFILGGPHETTQTMERTLEFAKHLLVDVAPGSFECSASFLTPLPGTDIRARPDDYGVKLIDPDLVTSSNFNFCTAETTDLKRDEINNFHRRFVEEMGNRIYELMPMLPRKVIEAHARLLHRFKIITAYGQRLGEFPRMKEYFDVVGEDRLEPAARLADDDLLERFPTRVSSAVRMQGERMTVLRGPTLLQLNDFGSRVFALCSGKLKTHEVVAHLAQSLNGSRPPDEVLRADVLQFLRHLDENYAVFFKDF
jgi:anaerobic magnesium-protoporphyrin IX monomethyl ester cyclase